MTGDTTARLPVVVGVENTEAGRLAVRWAADEAARRGLPLRLVHALDWPAGAPRPQYSHATGTPVHHRDLHRVHATSWPTQVYRDPDLIPPARGWGDKFRDAGRAAVDNARTIALADHPDLEIVDALTDGEPVRVLRTEAEDAAMVVLGSRHLSSVAEALTTGGVAVPVAAHAACPVVVVRGPEQHGTIHPFLVVGVDGSPHSEPAIGFAFDTASRRGAVLDAVFVTHATGLHSANEADKEAGIALAESLAGWKARYPDVVVRPQIAHGHTVHALVLASRQALGLVVGTRGLGGFQGMVLGSVSRGVLHHATCPVIVVPETDDASGTSG
ncbi:universal stress protein [Yinghuangia seranimata]|uniref:universal stress protein n=1 Tax=Yinghuangia seranimata TaxID=408067 RepID=UPI00248B0395|nr:universal stress protein [Yinghuangia seranimata]MDI2129519.1 universal stress protein [Yinghuangia seranimata]